MRATPAALLLLAACSIQNRPVQRWYGELTPTITRPGCTPSKAALSLRQNEIVFTPDEGTWVLTGQLTGATVAATHDHPTPDHKTYHTALQATLTGTVISGTYTTPVCTFRVELHPSG